MTSNEKKIRRKNAERKVVQTRHILERFEAMRECFAGDSLFEAEYHSAVEKYRTACSKINAVDVAN